jgi:hypothetical protein
MLPFNLEKGMTTSSWYAELALRILVRKSAIGSVMDMWVVPFSAGSSGLIARMPGPMSWFHRRSLLGRVARRARVYQEDLVTPGSSPACAISRRQIRHRPNLR